MKAFFYFGLIFLLIIIVSCGTVNASSNESIQNYSKIKIIKKYTEKFCKSKEDNFFEGLENEKTLKYSYFRYIGFQDKEILSKGMYKSLINQIKENCMISNEEEIELHEFFLKGADS